LKKKQEEKTREIMSLIGGFMLLTIGGIAYEKMFYASMTRWPLRFGGAAIVLLLILLSVISYSVFCEIKEKKLKKKEGG
jgi:uncharacterized membrane protein YcaP (DUF421 family)